MEQPGSANISWTCPSCGRRVPRRVDECRCGFQHAETPADAPIGAPQPSAPPRQDWHHVVFLSLLVIVAGGIVALYLLRESAPVPATAAATTSARAAQVSLPVADAAPALVDTPTESAPPTTPDPPATASLEDVVSRILPAVASITAGPSRGTGFFIKPDQVLTNAHVIQGQTSVTLQVGNATYNAQVQTVSTGSDLALLKVYGANPSQPVLTMGSVGHARVGQEVIAVGPVFTPVDSDTIALRRSRSISRATSRRPYPSSCDRNSSRSDGRIAAMTLSSFCPVKYVPDCATSAHILADAENLGVGTCRHLGARTQKL
jgi:hypothetical protein